MRNAKKDSMATRVLEVIQQNPGVNVGYIAEKLKVDSVSVKNTIGFHRREGRIINRGRAGRGASWYPNYNNPDIANGKESMTDQDWKAELQKPTFAHNECRKCGRKPTVARILISAQEKAGVEKSTRNQKFNTISSKSVTLCANCIVKVYKAVESTLSKELGESE